MDKANPSPKEDIPPMLNESKAEKSSSLKVDAVNSMTVSAFSEKATIAKALEVSRLKRSVIN